MDKFNDHQIARAILRMRYGVATEEEKRQFEAWIKGGQGRQELYDKIVADESLKEHLNLKSGYDRSVDYQKLQSDILRSLHKRDRQRRAKRYALWCGSAAAVLLVASMIVFRYIERPREVVKERIEIVKITPEPVINDNVILVLSDGKKVGVSGMRQDSLELNTAVVKGHDDKLVYESRVEQEDSVIFEEPEINKIVTSTGGFYALVLSDGTRVWLNSESELEYPVLFGKGERVVKLAGEAYFEVKPDVSRPFIVETREIRTRVLGTSFNIKAYTNESEVSTTLFTGKVAVSPLVDSTRKVVLVPGRRADWNLQTHRLNVHEANLEHALAWKEGMFVFSKENIEVVTRQIERWYGVKFVYELANRDEYTVNGYFNKDETLESILKVFTLTGGPKFKIEGNVVYVRDNDKK